MPSNMPDNTDKFKFVPVRETLSQVVHRQRHSSSPSLQTPSSAVVCPQINLVCAPQQWDRLSGHSKCQFRHSTVNQSSQASCKHLAICHVTDNDSLIAQFVRRPSTGQLDSDSVGTFSYLQKLQTPKAMTNNMSCKPTVTLRMPISLLMLLRGARRPSMQCRRPSMQGRPPSMLSKSPLTIRRCEPSWAEVASLTAPVKSALVSNWLSPLTGWLLSSRTVSACLFSFLAASKPVFQICLSAQPKARRCPASV